MSAHAVGTLRCLALAATMLAGAAPLARADMPSAVRTSTRPVTGLQAAGRIIVDHWGIPHVFAANM